MYYVTVCTKNRENILSEIKLNDNCCRGRVPPLPNENNYIIEYTLIGKIIKNTVENINEKNYYKINNYIIMSDRIHFIVQINNDKGRGGTLPLLL